MGSIKQNEPIIEEVNTMLTLDQVMNESIWIAKMNWGRMSGTYEEMKVYAESEDCRDFDLCAQQPEHLQEFFDGLWAWSEANGWITIPEYYKDIYLVEQNEKKAARRVWTEEEIKNLVQTNDKVLYGALKKLYAEQTADEQQEGATRHSNGVGFNGADSAFLSSVAEFLNRTGFLTNKQKIIVRKKLVKYNKQLTRLANA